MENFATKKLEELIVELKEYKFKEEQKLNQKIGITRQFIRENIEGIEKTILIINTALLQLSEKQDIIKEEKDIDANVAITAVTPEMERFATEYGLFIVSIGQIYINALSPHFTTESSMEIFKRQYWGRDWFK